MGTPPWWGPDGIPGTDDDWTQEQVAAHLARQDGVPDGFVLLDTGELRPLGGSADNGEES